MKANKEQKRREQKQKEQNSKIKFISISLAIIILLLVGGFIIFHHSGETKMVKVQITTNKGNIIVELNQEKAPITVTNFLSYVDEGFYNNTIFHRVIDGFMIQGGGFTENGTQKKTKAPIKLESNNGLHNKRGTIAMARTNIPDSATAQFFINTVDNDFLDYQAGNPGYAVFGNVVEGMNVVDAITKVQTGNRPMPDWPVEPVIIESITRVE